MPTPRSSWEVPSERARVGVPLEIGPDPAAGRGPRGPGGFGRAAIREAPYEVVSALGVTGWKPGDVVDDEHILRRARALELRGARS